LIHKVDTAVGPLRAWAFDAWRKGRDNFGEELADVAIYLLSLAEMTGVDLQDDPLRETLISQLGRTRPPASNPGPAPHRGHRDDPALEPARHHGSCLAGPAERCSREEQRRAG
jgi:hypothetical protein